MNKKEFTMPLAIMVGAAVMVALFAFWSVAGNDDNNKTNIAKVNTNQPKTTKNLTTTECTALSVKTVDLLVKENHCEVDAECVVNTEFTCPFGCYNLFNKNSDLTKIRSHINEYYGGGCGVCIYDCNVTPLQDEVECQEGKCVDTNLIVEPTPYLPD